MKTNILILCVGQIESEVPGAERYSACLAEMGNVSLLEKIVINTRRIRDSQYVFALLDKDIEHFHLEKVVNLLDVSSMVIRMPERMKGLACFSLFAASRLDSDHSLLIISDNELVDMDFSKIIADFHQRELDGGIIVFPSADPCYPHVCFNQEGLITEVAQQGLISHHATAEVFWFAKCGDFVEGVKDLIRNNVSINGEFFIASVLNELILRQAKIGLINLDISKYSPLRNERQLQRFAQGTLI